MNLSERIRTVLNEKAIDQVELAKAAGVTKGAVNQWLDGKIQSLKLEYAVGIKKAFGYNSEWLVLGMGPKAGDDTGIVINTKRHEGPPEGYMRLRLLDATPYMGAEGTPVDFPEIIKYVDVLKSYLSTAIGGHPENLDLLPGRGDSMSGTIEHGDLVFVDRTVRSFDGDGIYVIVWQDGLMIKRLQAMPDGGMCIMSDNPRYKNFDLAPEKVETLTICARVHGKWGVTRF